MTAAPIRRQRNQVQGRAPWPRGAACTFTTSGQPGERGTVQGHYGTTHTHVGETCACIAC